MNQQTRIRKIMAKTNCSYDQALEADNESNGNIELAYEMAQKKANELYVGGGSSGLAVMAAPTKSEIKGYKNGLLVNNKFYDYSENDNIRLKKMLEVGEFDAEVLGVQDNKAEVVYVNCEHEEYQKEPKVEQPQAIEERRGHTLDFGPVLTLDCPDEIIMDKDGDVKFKILVGGRRILVLMSDKMSVSDLYKELAKYTDKKVVLLKGDKKIRSTDDISVLKRNMFMLREEK